MSNEIDDKLVQCQRAIGALADLRTRQDKDAFEYHFCAYIGFAGAVRQYFQVRLKKQLKSTKPVDEQFWLDGLETDLNVATVIGLRNSDVHSNALRISHQDINVTIWSGYQAQTHVGALKAQVTDAQTGQVKHEASMAQPEPSPLQPQSPPPTTEFFCQLDPNALPKDFMLADREYSGKGAYGRIPGKKANLAKHDPLPMKAKVLSHLAATDLGSIAESSYAAFSGAIANARSTVWGRQAL
jgi:hypothetical protein